MSAIQKPAQRKRSLSPKTRQPRNKSHSSESEEEKRESNNANNAKEEEPKEEIEEEQKHTEGEVALQIRRILQMTSPERKMVRPRKKLVEGRALIKILFQRY